jgi:hypothetical protein
MIPSCSHTERALVVVRRILGEFAAYYNKSRTHRALSQDAPVHRAIERLGAITSRPVLGGLHHQLISRADHAAYAANMPGRTSMHPATVSYAAGFIDRASGKVWARKFTVAHDCGQIIELMAKKEVLDFKLAPRPERLATNLPNSRRNASIASDDALILPHRANPRGWNFRERQVIRVDTVCPSYVPHML